jgi:hypothetical protein
MPSNIQMKVEGLDKLAHALQWLPKEVESKVLQEACTTSLKEAFYRIQHAAPTHDSGEISKMSRKYGSIVTNLQAREEKEGPPGQQGRGHHDRKCLLVLLLRIRLAPPARAPVVCAGLQRLGDGCHQRTQHAPRQRDRECVFRHGA